MAPHYHHIVEMIPKRSTEDNSKIFFFFFLNKNVCWDSSLELSEVDISVRGHKICLKELYGKLFLNYPSENSNMIYVCSPSQCLEPHKKHLHKAVKTTTIKLSEL